MTGISGRCCGNSAKAGISGAVLGLSALEHSGSGSGRGGSAKVGASDSKLGNTEGPGASRCRGDSAVAGTSGRRLGGSERPRDSGIRALGHDGGLDGRQLGLCAESVDCRAFATAAGVPGAPIGVTVLRRTSAEKTRIKNLGAQQVRGRARRGEF